MTPTTASIDSTGALSPARPSGEAGRGEGSSLPLALLEWLLIPAGLAIILFALPHDLIGDDNARFRMLSSLLDGSGRVLGTKYSFVGPIFSAPLWALGRALGNPAQGVLLYDWLLFCGALCAFYFLLRRRWDPVALRHFLLLLVAGSLFSRHLLHYGAEAFTNLVVGLGLTCIGLGLGRFGWPLAMLGAVNTPATFPGFALAAARWTWERRRLRYLLAPAAVVVLILLDTWARMGSPFHTGYEGDAGVRTLMPYSGRPGLSYPFFFGLLSLTLSFGKGLAFFACGLWILPWLRRLPFPDDLRAVLRLWLSFLLGLILLYSNYWGWYGGVSAGPRYLLFATFPATLLLAQLLAAPPKHWAGTLGALLLLALSCWTTTATTVFEQGGVDLCTRNNYAFEHLCWFTPEFSVLWNPFVAPFNGLKPGEWTVLGYEAVVFALLALPLAKNLALQLRDRLAALDPWRAWRV